MNCWWITSRSFYMVFQVSAKVSLPSVSQQGGPDSRSPVLLKKNQNETTKDNVKSREKRKNPIASFQAMQSSFESFLSENKPVFPVQKPRKINEKQEVF